MRIATLLCVWCASVLLPSAVFAQITITGVADKTTYNNSVTLTVGTQAGYNYNATLNLKPLATGAPVVVNKPDFYELRVDATNQTTMAVTSQYLRFIVNSSERVGTEWGLPPHVPFPVIQSCSNEFLNGELRLLVPLSWPQGLPLPVVAWVRDQQAHPLRVNGICSMNGARMFQVKRGVGSGLLPSSAFANAESTDAQFLVGALQTNVTIYHESNVAWTTVSGVLSGNTVWGNGSRIHVTGGLTVPAGSTLTIGEGTIVRMNPRADITNNGTVTANGSLFFPVVFLPATNGQPWGGFVMRNANQGVVNASYTVFTGSGAEPNWFGANGNPGSHRSEQALFFCQAGQQLNLTDSAAIYLAGQLGHSVGATTIFNATRFLMQRTTTGGEWTGARFTVNDSAFIECPDDSVNFVDGDNDGLYLVDGTHNFTNTLFGWTKDDGVDSGGDGLGRLHYEQCWFESTFHEGNSLSGLKNTTAHGTVYFDCGQGIEDGYGPSSSAFGPTGRVDTCFFGACQSGARHGDNYPSIGNGYPGIIGATNSILIYNHRDIFGFNWRSTGWTNATGQMFFTDNFLTDSNSYFPSNAVWNGPSDGWRLAQFGGQSRVGVGFGVRGTSLSQFPDGIPVGLSRFCTNEVRVDYAVDGSDGTHATGTLVFPAGLTRLFIPAPTNTASVYRFALNNPLNADVTGGRFYIGTISGGTASLVASNANWRYFDKTNDLGVAWRGRGYDDSSWSNGVAQLGFGDGDEATTIASNQQYTTYFRRLFTVSEPSAFTNVSLWLLRDDAGVVFVNSNEVYRSSNLPAAPNVITNRMLASSTGENTIDTATISVTNLIAGTNIVAVEIHQQSLTSSDVSFALSLTGNPFVPGPRMGLVRLGDEVVIVSSDNTTVIEEAAQVTGPWTPVLNVNPPFGFTLGNAQKFYRLRK